MPNLAVDVYQATQLRGVGSGAPCAGLWPGGRPARPRHPTRQAVDLPGASILDADAARRLRSNGRLSGLLGSRSGSIAVN